MNVNAAQRHARNHMAEARAYVQHKEARYLVGNKRNGTRRHRKRTSPSPS